MSTKIIQITDLHLNKSKEISTNGINTYNSAKKVLDTIKIKEKDADFNPHLQPSRPRPSSSSSSGARGLARVERRDRAARRGRAHLWRRRARRPPCRAARVGARGIHTAQARRSRSRRCGPARQAGGGGAADAARTCAAASCATVDDLRDGITRRRLARRDALRVWRGC